jgi:hypothetical protein
MAVRNHYAKPPLSVSTLTIVGGLTRPEYLVEVEMTAAKADSAQKCAIAALLCRSRSRVSSVA